MSTLLTIISLFYLTDRFSIPPAITLMYFITIKAVYFLTTQRLKSQQSQKALLVWITASALIILRTFLGKDKALELILEATRIADDSMSTTPTRKSQQIQKTFLVCIIATAMIILRAFLGKDEALELILEATRIADASMNTAPGEELEDPEAPEAPKAAEVVEFYDGSVLRKEVPFPSSNCNVTLCNISDGL